MRATIHQPTYLPYLGVFAKIGSADIFVIYDTAQYEKGNVHNRQQIRTAQGSTWLTIPLSSSLTPFNETMISYRNQRIPWYEKHWRSIESSYQKTPFFPKYRNELFELYHSGHPRTLGEFNLSLIKFFLREFKLEKKVLLFSDLAIKQDFSPSEKLAAATEKAGADEYVSGPSGKRYLELEPFAERGLEVSFFHFQHPVYHQFHSRYDKKFLPNMAALDALMNLGSLPPFGSPLPSSLEKAGAK